MKDQDAFPAMAVQMVSLGEESGKLGEMLVLVAETGQQYPGKNKDLPCTS